MTPSHLLSHSR